jgi:DNA-binding MarR family transcriptional regulator
VTPRRLSDADYERLLAFRTELRHFLQWSETEAGAHGLTPALHQLLLAVRGYAGNDGPTVGTVAAALSVKHHTAVELAQRAERGGLITRERDEADHRLVHLTLTGLGAEKLEQLTRLHLHRIGPLAERLAGLSATH